MKNFFISMFMIAALSGCAGKVETQKIQAKSNGSVVEVAMVAVPSELNNNRYTVNKLREVRPVHAQMGMGLSIVTALLGGNADSNAFDKENYKGTLIDFLDEPTREYFLPEAQKIIAEWLETEGNGYVYKEPLFIAPAQWSLIYEDMLNTDGNYNLKYRVIFYKKPENGNYFSRYIMSECSPAPGFAPLADWRDNSYQRVTQETQQMMRICLLRFKRELPRLLRQG